MKFNLSVWSDPFHPMGSVVCFENNHAVIF